MQYKQLESSFIKPGREVCMISARFLLFLHECPQDEPASPGVPSEERNI